MNQIRVIDIDPDCFQFGKTEIISGRGVIYNHNKQKSTNRIKKILTPYTENIVENNFVRLSRQTLVNILSDFCYTNNARQLLSGVNS